METVANGVTINYERSGNGKKRVLLLHGWGCSMELMRHIQEALEPDMDVLTLDFPGFGHSGRPPEPWGVPEYAACVQELLRQEDFVPCSVIAHSFGARIAVFLGSRDHSLFEKMILTGAAGIRPPQTEAGKKRQAAFKKWKAFAQALRRTRVLGHLADSVETAAREKYGSSDYNKLDEEMRKTFVRVISLDLTDSLHAISAPTLLIWGDGDTETPLWMGKKMEELIPDAGLVIFEGGTHFAYLEQHARFATIAHHFLMED